MVEYIYSVVPLNHRIQIQGMSTFDDRGKKFGSVQRVSVGREKRHEGADLRNKRGHR